MTEDRIDLAVFIADLSGGGASRVMVTLAEAFARRGLGVDLVVMRPQGRLRPMLSPDIRLVDPGGPATRRPWVASKRGRLLVAGVPGLVRYLRRRRPRVLLSATFAVNLAAVWAEALARSGVRLVVSEHAYFSRSARRGRKRYERWLLRRSYPRAAAIVAVSNGVAADLAQVSGLPRERIATIHNPVVTPDMTDKMQAALGHPWFAPGGPPVLLGIGRLVAAKDFPTLIRAFARLRAGRPARLMILGEGKTGAARGALLALAGRLGVAGDVALPGHVDNPLAYLARASVFVLSSAWEGFGNVLVEALACGCPVVSTDCPGGPAEILDGGACGALVPVGDDAALAEAILSTLDEPPAAERLRARAARFSVDAAVERYLDVLFDGPLRAPLT